MAKLFSAALHGEDAAPCVSAFLVGAQQVTTYAEPFVRWKKFCAKRRVCKFHLGDILVPKMRELVESLGVFSAPIIVAVLSVGVVWLLCSKLSLRFGALWAVIVPLIVAYSLYWSPVWFGADPSEYGVWSFIIVAWFFVGFFPSAILVRVLQKRGAKKTSSI